MRWSVPWLGALLLSLSLPARADLVGKIDGSFAVSPSGAATYDVPITVPPGTAGMQPELALRYDSQGPNGPLGVGFALSGQSAIARCPSDRGRDGAIRAVQIDRGDRLCLDGERLVAVAGAYGMPGSEYRTERESWARIVGLGSADPTDPDAGAREFRVEGRDGRIRFYGSTDDSRIEAQGTRRVRLWALARIEDRSGNVLRYRYLEDVDGGEFELARIDYGENAAVGSAPYASVRLVWEDRPDPESGYVAGSLVSATRRLAALETWYGEERVREYRLSYEANPRTRRSRIAALTLCGLGGECLPPTVFGWEKGLPGWRRSLRFDLPRELWADSNAIGELADVNGDGRVDFVHDGSASQRPNTWLNTGDGFGAADEWRTPDDLYAAGRGMPHALFSDVNGDGLPDYVRSFRASDASLQTETRLNTGSGWAETASPGFRTPDFMWDYIHDHDRQRGVLIDLDGDDLPDFVTAFNDGNAPVRDTYLNTGTRFAPRSGSWTLPVSLWRFEDGEHHTEATLVDLNGDGLPDLLQAVVDNDGTEHRSVWLNTGSGFTGPVVGWRPPAAIWDYSPSGGDPTAKAVRQEALLADVNGDGLPDFVVCFERGDGHEVLETHLNTGEGWVRQSAWTLPSHVWTYAGAKHRMHAQLVDVNGDGFLDLVRAFDSSQGVKKLDTWLNTRQGFPDADGETPGYEPPTPIWSYSDSPETRATFADVDGDGLADLVRANRTGDLVALETHVNQGTLGDRVSEIRDGLGALTEIEYAALTSPEVYEIGSRAPWPQATVVDPIRVVRRVGSGPTVDALHTVSLRYGSMRFDRLRRLNLGFAWRESTDESTGIVTTETSHQDWPLQGLADTTVRARSDGTVLARTQHLYELAASSPAGVTAILERETREESFELDGAAVSTTRTARDFDAFANVVLESVQWSDGATRTTRTTFANDSARWLLGMVQRIEMTAGTPDAPAQTRTRANEYDSRGRLVREILEPDHPELRLERVHGFDLAGNLAATETRGFGIDSQSELTFFDSRAHQPVLELNPLGQSRSSAIDPRFGTAVRVFDANPAIPPTTIALDALGRPVATTRPDGVTTTTARAACDAACPAGAAMSVRTETPGGGATTRYLDALGRELRSESLGFAGRLVRIDRGYDLRGNPIQHSRPYYAGDAAQVSEVRFDELDRPLEVRTPDQALTTYAYAPLRVKITDPLRHEHTERRDPRGALVELIDPNGASSPFTLDGFGQVVSARDPAGNETRSTYDLRGRVVAVADPNLGLWTFRYDALGHRTAQTDARGTQTRFSYDRLGRLVRRDNGGTATTWTWDTAPNGIGRIARVAASPGATVREESYDGLGRPSASTVRLANGSLRLLRLYDGFGRVSRIVYPGGFSVLQRYAESGQLASVSGANGEGVFWTAESRIADGRVDRERFGNGLRTDRIYEPETGRLERILTGDGSAPAIQSLSYDWDARGNLRSRADQNLGVAEAFGYDELDRLQGSTSATLGTLELRYDAAGNLTYKTGHGAYQYPVPGSARPHAVLATSDDGRRFSYDADGNLLGDGAGRGLVWFPDNRLAAVSQGGSEGSFEFFGYGPEGELLTRLEIDTAAGGASTCVVQLGDLFESASDLRTGRVERRHMIYADGALVAVHTTGPGAAGTRYVHRDHLDSTNALTDSSRNLVERVGYDPHGEVRAQPTGADDPSTLLRVAPRGFTGALQLRRSHLVHLRGRVYDPRLGRFLSPDPAASAATDSQSQNGYAYARNNPLALVDPTGFAAEEPASSGDTSLLDSFLGAIGAAWAAVQTAAITVGNGVAGAVAATASFLSSTWGGIRFAATAAWNGIGWAGGALASGAADLGKKAWDVYNDDINLGILPDKRVPFGLPQSIVLGFWQWKYQKLELYWVWKEGGHLYIESYGGPLKANVSINGQQNSLPTAAENAVREFGGERCILAYDATINLVSDTVESALLKFAPSAASRQLAEMLTTARDPIHAAGHSQGTLTLFWGIRLADRKLDNVTVDFFGPAASTMAYHFLLWKTGAKEGPYGYVARNNDPVATFAGGNFTGGFALPLLLPERLIFSAGSIVLLPFPSISPHAAYP